MQLPNLQANKAASSTVAPKKQTSIRPQSGGLMKATMTKSLMPDKGNEIKSSATPERSMMRTTSMTPTSMTPPSQNTSTQPNRYTPQTMGVTSDMRVEDRVLGLMSADNPLMQKAREQANRMSASRGLQSSSIATENATNAMFNAALPIAQQDANTYTTTAQLNNQNAHDVGMQDNASLNQLMLNKDGQAFTAGESAKDRSLQERLQDKQFAFEGGQTDADRALQRELQESQQNFQAGENSQNRSFEKEMQELQYKNQLGILSAEEAIRMRELESQQAFQGQQNQADRTLQERLQESQQQFQSGENQADRSFQQELEGLRYQNSLGLLDAEGQQRMRELESQQSFQSGENAADRNFQQELEQLRYENSLGMLDAEGEQRMRELETQQEFQAGQTQADREFTASENQANRDFQAGQTQQQYENQRGLMEMEQQFQSGENQANRDFQMEMEKYKTASQLEVNMALQDDMQAFNQGLEEMRNAHQMGMLDAEGEQRMRELEAQNENAISQMDRSAEIQTARDTLLQQFQGDNMQLEMANRLTEIEAQAKAQLDMQSQQNDFAQRLEYSNAVSAAVNYGIEALGNAFMNPEIDPSQYNNIQTQINRMVQDRIGQYEDIYGIGGEVPSPDPYSENRGNGAANGVDNRIPGGTTGGSTVGRNPNGGSIPSPGTVTRQQSVGGGLMGSAAHGRYNVDLPPMAIK